MMNLRSDIKKIMSQEWYFLKMSTTLLALQPILKLHFWFLYYNCKAKKRRNPDLHIIKNCFV